MPLRDFSLARTLGIAAVTFIVLTYTYLPRTEDSGASASASAALGGISSRPPATSCPAISDKAIVVERSVLSKHVLPNDKPGVLTRFERKQQSQKEWESRGPTEGKSTGFMVSQTSEAQYDSLLKVIARELRIQSEKSATDTNSRSPGQLVELGAGIGYALHRLQEWYPSQLRGRTIGTDLVASNVVLGKQKYPGLLDLRQGAITDVAAAGVSDSWAGLGTFAIGVHMYLVDENELCASLREMLRVTALGGRVAIIGLYDKDDLRPDELPGGASQYQNVQSFVARSFWTTDKDGNIPAATACGGSRTFERAELIEDCPVYCRRRVYGVVLEGVKCAGHRW